MKFYTLRSNSDPKVIGVNNGVAQVFIDQKSFTNKDAYMRVINFFSGIGYWQNDAHIPDFNFSIDRAKTYKGAILTDFISFNPYLIGCPFIVSRRISEVLKNFNLQEYRSYQVNIEQNDKLYLYELFYFPMFDYDIIDFSQSSFVPSSSLQKKERLNFKDKQELIDYMDTNPFVRGEKICLNNQFDKNLDLFDARFGGPFISERLRKELERNGVTGAVIGESIAPSVEVANQLDFQHFG